MVKMSLAKTRLTMMQKRILLNIAVENYPSINLENETLWEPWAVQLNSTNGPVRHWTSWRRTWIGLRSSILRRATRDEKLKPGEKKVWDIIQSNWSSGASTQETSTPERDYFFSPPPGSDHDSLYASPESEEESTSDMDFATLEVTVENDMMEEGETNKRKRPRKQEEGNAKKGVPKRKVRKIRHEEQNDPMRKSTPSTSSSDPPPEPSDVIRNPALVELERMVDDVSMAPPPTPHIDPRPRQGDDNASTSLIPEERMSTDEYEFPPPTPRIDEEGSCPTTSSEIQQWRQDAIDEDIHLSVPSTTTVPGWSSSHSKDMSTESRVSMATTNVTWSEDYFSNNPGQPTFERNDAATGIQNFSHEEIGELLGLQSPMYQQDQIAGHEQHRAPPAWYYQERVRLCEEQNRLFYDYFNQRLLLSNEFTRMLQDYFTRDLRQNQEYHERIYTIQQQQLNLLYHQCLSYGVIATSLNNQQPR